ncbi:MAG: hypothetical protein QOG62_2525 [Thermoleophilaceae bacterium]|jgi:cation diffusion facilitator CzcD-associated flavoprotein CzcO|nr:hypothetical protein [Thermoleophilaceae bacterium]
METAEVIVIGAGISGIGTAVKLREQGFEVLLLEKADQVGGTWRDNTYPGCACDIPSTLYSFSFAPNAGWTRVFAEQAEIQEYVTTVADDYGIPAITHFGTEVLDAGWSAADSAWHLDTTRGPYRAAYLVIAVGPLHEPVLPDVAGLERFQGTAFHSARWDHDHDLAGERVAVIGTGASAAQFVPEIQPAVGQMTIFQRTPGWVMPKLDWRLSRLEQGLLARTPGLQRAVRAAIWAGIELVIQAAHQPWISKRFETIGRWNIRRAIADPQLRSDLTPAYTLGCKRVMVSNAFYPAVAKPNVKVVPHAVREIRERSVVDAEGTEHQVDTIIFGTGFHVHDLPIADRVHGRDGRSLAEVWDGSPRAFLGTSIAGFPNAFMLFGPNVGTASAFAMLDAQLSYMVSGMTQARERNLAAMDIRPEIQAEYNEEVRRALEGSVWNAGGCSSYYLDAHGFNASAWPWSMLSLQRRLRRFPIEAFETIPAEVAAQEPVAAAGGRS